MVKTEREYRQDIVDIGRQVSQRGWVAACGGSISIRLDGERILVTPAGVSLGMMHADDPVVVDRQGGKLSGRGEPAEVALHLAVYRLRGGSRAAIHAWPPVAAGYAAAGKPLADALPADVTAGLGCVAAAGADPARGSALVELLLPLLPAHEALLVAGQGAVCCGEDVCQAWFRLETIEHFARVRLVEDLLGGPRVPERAEADTLLDSRLWSAAVSRPAVATRLAAGTEAGGEERFTVTRSELIAMVDEALRARSAAG